MRERLACFGFTAAALAAFSAQAADLSVSIRWQGPSEQPPSELVAKIYPVNGGGDAPAALEASISHARKNTVATHAGEWWLVVDGPDAWAEVQRVKVPQAGSEVVVQLWPGGWAAGTLVPPRDEEPPQDLRARFAPSPAAEGPKQALQRCRMSGNGRFRCKLPALELDLRLRAEPYITHYRWGLKVPRGGVADVGELKLERGASLVGWVAAEDGSPIAPTAQASLQPAGLATPVATDVTPRSSLMKREVPVNDRGFFHFDGIAPGEYVVTATQAPFAPATSAVSVLAGLEAELAAPLLLAKPEALSVAVSPAQTPYGDPWRALIFRQDSRRGRMERVKEATFELDGFLKIEGLPRGRYVVQVLGIGRNAWAIRQVELGEDAMPVNLEIKAVQVDGQVMLGDEPVVARIWFGGKFGGEQVELVSGDGGQFTGVLPRPGEWRVEIQGTKSPVNVALEKVLVEPRNGDPVAYVKLELPATKVIFEVVDSENRPVPRALVDLDPGAGQITGGPVQDRTDERGRVEIRGVPPGAYVVTASASLFYESAPTAVTLAEDREAPPVVLRLRALRRVRLKAAAHGVPVPGATVFAYAPNDLQMTATQQETDVSGEVELRLEPKAELVQFFIQSPGHAFQMGQTALPGTGVVAIELSPEMGALRLRAPVASEARRPNAVVWHNGMNMAWSGMAMLNRAAHSSGILGNELTIPNAEPGEWALCPERADGALPTLSSACVSGVLAPNGTLELELK